MSKLRAALDSDTVDKLVFLNKRLKSMSVQQSAVENASVSIKTEPQSSEVEPQSRAVKVETNMPPLPNLPTLN